MATSGATHILEAGEGVRVRNRLAAVRAVDPYDASQVAEMRYKADITAGALKLPESRLIADLLLRKVDAEGWKDAIVKRNVLQARNPATARRLTRLIRGRLETMGPRPVEAGP